jgi:hypothetical protein
MTTEEMVSFIADTRTIQADIAGEYLVFMAAEKRGESVNWTPINEAIMNRWSKGGLERVKAMAWARLSLVEMLQ